MDETAIGLLVALALTVAIPLACVLFPSLIPADRLNQEGHRYFVDIQFFKIGAGIAVLMCVFSAFKQGDMQFGIVLIAIALGLALALLMGWWAHLVWRRQQSLESRRLRSGWLP